MPGLGGFGHQTERERKAAREKAAAEEAKQLVANNEVEVDASGKITGNKHTVEGNIVEEGRGNTQPNLPVIDQADNDTEWFDELPPPGEGFSEDPFWRDEEMDVDAGDGVPEQTMAARAAGGGMGSSTVSKETPISNYPSLSYGLQETHTTILPWTGWLTATGLDKGTPLQLKIRMNTPHDMLDMTTGSLGSIEGARINGTKQFINRTLDGDGRVPDEAALRYPVEFGVSATTAVERPAWRDYWGALYDFYTVLGCEYEIILYNPIQVRNIRLGTAAQHTVNTLVYPAIQFPIDCGFFNSDCVVATQFDTYSSTATTTGNVMPQTYYQEARAFKELRWTPVKGGQKAVIRGTYKPGQAKRNIINDGDVKTWTATGQAPTTLQEILTLNFWTDPFFSARLPDPYENPNSLEPATLSAGPAYTGNLGAVMGGTVEMEINLKYIVQYKDLKQQGRYPNSITTDQFYYGE